MISMKTLIIGKVWPEPNSSAAGKRMKQLIELFSSIGDVHFACANQLTGNEIDFEELGVKTHKITLNDDAVDVLFASLSPEIVVFDRFLTEEQYAWRIMEQCPKALRILDSEDLHFLRRTRHQFVKETAKVANQIDQLDFQNGDTMRELAAIYRCDLTLIISPFELELLTNEMKVPSELLYYLPIFTELNSNPPPSFEQTNDFLFIGNYLHEPNADAINVLLQQNVWSEISKQVPAAKLIVAGAYPSQQLMQNNNHVKKIDVVGHVQLINEVYQSVHVSLVPLRFGAGIKGKILESMEMGVPFITTSIGAEGMFFDESWSDCVSDDWSDFVKKAVSLYQNEQQWTNFQKKGYQHLKQYFDKSKLEQTFLEMIQMVMKSLPEIRKKRYFSQVLQHQTLMSTKYLSKWIMEKNKE